MREPSDAGTLHGPSYERRAAAAMTSGRYAVECRTGVRYFLLRLLRRTWWCFGLAQMHPPHSHTVKLLQLALGTNTTKQECDDRREKCTNFYLIWRYTRSDHCLLSQSGSSKYYIRTTVDSTVIDPVILYMTARKSLRHRASARGEASKIEPTEQCSAKHNIQFEDSNEMACSGKQSYFLPCDSLPSPSAST